MKHQSFFAFALLWATTTAALFMVAPAFGKSTSTSTAEQACLDMGFKQHTQPFYRCREILEKRFTPAYDASPPTVQSQPLEPVSGNVARAREQCRQYGYGEGTADFARCVQSTTQREDARSQAAETARTQQEEARTQAADNARRRCANEWGNPDGSFNPGANAACRADPDGYFARKPPPPSAPARTRMTCTRHGDTVDCY